MAPSGESGFKEVHDKEKSDISASRQKREVRDRKDMYIGLALSGGGIRSATFNLGVLQGLARLGLLPWVDYLSTVSGGGYIGAWLVAWLKRASFKDVVAGLQPEANAHSGQGETATPQIEFLRDYSNYLTPHVGFLTADTWTAIVTVARNLLLNLLILVSAAVGVLLVPYWLVAVASYCGGCWALITSIVLEVAAFALFGVFYWPAMRAADGSGSAPAPDSGQTQPSAGQPGVGTPQGLIVAFIGSCLFASAYLGVSWAGKHATRLRSPHWVLCVLVVIIAIWLALGLLLVAWLRLGKKHTQPDWNQPAVFSIALVSFSLLSIPAVLWVLAQLARIWPCNLSALVSWGVPIVVLVYLLAAALQVGLAGLLLRNEVREWTARLGAWLLILSLAWASLFGIAIYTPFVALRIGAWIGGTLTLAWVAHTVAGVWSAFSPRSGKSGSRNWFDILAVTAPPVFALGLLVLLSFGIYRVSVPVKPPGSAASHFTLECTVEASPGSLTVTQPHPRQKPAQLSLAQYLCSIERSALSKAWLALVSLGLLLLAWLLSLRIDINEFSMHTFYRNRLVRCYLGASRPPDDTPAPGNGATEKQQLQYDCRRRPDRFTGFDPADDLLLASLASSPQQGPQERTRCNQQPYAGPYPILNAALNLTHGRRLAWQERKAESFTFTPRFCGGAISGQDAYLPTGQYSYPPQGVYLGTAVAISGAAVSPLVGFHYSSAAGFLMTVFNARLGQWLANPARGEIQWNRFGPRVGLWCLLKELFGLMNDEAPYVCLSDGGIFENLGIYELVRRRVNFIIACDASADPELKFEDLGNAIRKCRSDFGVEIDLQVEDIRRDPAAAFSKSDFVVGTIKYSQRYGPDEPDGTLLYLKASLTGREPTDVLEYHSNHPEFPHQSTADQWFDESQFESYRRLGQYVAEKAFGPNGLDPDELK